MEKEPFSFITDDKIRAAVQAIFECGKLLATLELATEMLKDKPAAKESFSFTRERKNDN